MCTEMYVSNGQWNDIPCSKYLGGYICSSPKGIPTVIPEEPNKVCPHSSTRWIDLGTNFCYIIEKEKSLTNWKDAAEVCREAGSTLASFHSIEEVSVVLSHLQPFHGSAHIGLRQNSDGNFEWQDRSAFDFDNWDKGEPNSRHEKCGEMYGNGGKWNDMPCTKFAGYICSSPKVTENIFTGEEIEIQTNLTVVDIISENGDFHSPNYPENYSPNADWLWKIRASENNQVALTLRTIDLEYGADCEYDYIQVLDGHDAESTVLRKICGTNLPERILSSENKMAVRFVSDNVNERKGFSADFTSVERCGGIIVADQGVIRSKNYPENYNSNDMCIWKITVPEGFQVALQFNSFEVEDGWYKCENDYVEVTVGETEAVSEKFCGDSLPNKIRSPTNRMVIKFASDYSSEFEGFEAEFSKEICGGDITSEEGEILSPNYPEAYGRFEKCSWKITVPENHQVALKFESFQTEYSGLCNHDYVVIRDGHESNSSILGTFCGYDIPKPIRSSGNKLRVEFASDDVSQDYGFAAKFTKATIDPQEPEYCGEDIVADNGVISSPNFPENYGSLQECTWKITVPDGKEVTLQFESLDVEYNYDCEFDYVEIRDGHESESPVLGKFCGINVPEIIHSTQNLITVKFVSDILIEKPGFSLNFTQADICRKEIFADKGVISSPNYPENYGPATRCVWKITVPEDYQVSLKFLSFRVYCEYSGKDSVIIRDDYDEYNRVLFDSCGDLEDNLPYLRSKGNNITIEFTSDGFNEDTGFSVEFIKETCSRNIVADNGTFHSPNFPDNYRKYEFCIWKITVPENYQVLLRFLSFELESQATCNYDSVEILDGHESNSSLLRKFCGQISPAAIHSSTNQMTVKFTSDSSTQFSGFNAEFSKADAIEISESGSLKSNLCDEDIVAESGNIYSPNYPKYYRVNEDCIKNITVPENHQVILQFLTFQVESDADCKYDFVEVRDGHQSDSPLLGKFCGYEVPEIIHSSTNKMSVKFSTDSSVTRQGFTAKFESDVCDGEIVAASGKINSPDYPKFYRPNQDCTKKITVPENHQVILQFLTFEVESDVDCQHDFVEVRDGHQSDSPLLGKFCGDNVTAIIRSSTNKMSIKFKSDSSVSKLGFSAEFESDASDEEELLSLLRQLPSVLLEHKIRQQKPRN